MPPFVKQAHKKTTVTWFVNFRCKLYDATPRTQGHQTSRDHSLAGTLPSYTRYNAMVHLTMQDYRT